MPKTESEAYQHYDKLPDERRKCKYCTEPDEQIYSKTTSTSVLWNHINKYHSIMAKGKESNPLTKAQQEALTDAYIKWIVNDIQPFTTSDDPDFTAFIKLLNDKYTVPCRQTTQKLVMKKFMLSKEFIRETLQNIHGMFSLTTDLWTAINMDSYCGITVHFIDNQWRLRFLILDICPMPQPHTGEAIKDILLSVVTEFGIGDKLLTLATDNASSMVSGFKLLAVEMRVKYNREIYHIRCSTHVLNLAVQDGLKNLFDVEEEFDEDNLTSPLTKLRTAVNAIRRSPKNIDELKKHCENLEIEYHDLPHDCPTRWSSTYTMIKAALRQRRPLQVMFIDSESKYVKNALDQSDWDILEGNLKVLKIFAKATAILSAYKEPTLHQVEDVYSMIKGYLNNHKTNAHDVMAEKLDEYSDKISTAHWLAQILHPGVKLDKNDKKIRLKLAQLKKQAELTSTILSDAAQISSPNIPSTTKKSKSGLEGLQELVSDTINVDLNTQAVKYNAGAEIDHYLASPKVDRRDNPLAWWQCNEKGYPILSSLARHYLAVPASSVPCEQLFSIAGNTITKNRNSLAPETAQALLCLRSWLLFTQEHTDDTQEYTDDV